MKFFIIATALITAVWPLSSARAGLDLENQKEVPVQALDLDLDGRVERKEVAKYMFFYFDYDGNESLTNGEYEKAREITIIPYEGDAITWIDIDNDGKNDETSYTTETFIRRAMVRQPDAAADSRITARDFVDVGFLRLDTDRSKAIELEEWQKAYGQHAVIKPNQPPKAANNDRYGQ